jgi:hypothetical protein
MAWRVWHFITLVLVALLLGTTFGHTLEMPMKMNVDGRLWMTFQHTLDSYFAYIGAPIEIGAIISLGILSFFARHRSRSFYFLVLTATLCVAMAFFVVWLGFTNPVNAETAKWTTDAFPSDWAEWRRQWEYSHLARFVLHFIGFGALGIPLVLSSPEGTNSIRRSRS